jgi:hypothetical protein
VRLGARGCEIARSHSWDTYGEKVEAGLLDVVERRSLGAPHAVAA